MAKRQAKPKRRLKPLADSHMVGRIKYIRNPQLPHQDPAIRRLFAVSQARSIIDKFGGPRELARVLKVFSDNPKHHLSYITIYRWMYPREARGTDGNIPARHLPMILAAARFAGILITEKDVYPQFFGAKNGEKNAAKDSGEDDSEGD